MIGNLIGLWIVYFLGILLAFFGLGSAGFLDGALWAMLAASGFFSLLTCIYIKLTELHNKQKDIETKLDALLSQKNPPSPDNPGTSFPDAPQD